MKKSSLLALFTWAVVISSPASALVVPCIMCGNTVIPVPGGSGTLSYAVITAANFFAQPPFAFAGGVPAGTLDALGSVPAAGDFVYLYQLVNTGGMAGVPISSYEVTIGGSGGTFTAGGRLESAVFFDPAPAVLSPVSLGPGGPPGPVGALALPGLTPGPMVDFVPSFGFGACVDFPALNPLACSDGTTNLLPTSVQMTFFNESFTSPGGFPDLIPGETSSIMWFASPIAPVFGSATVFAAAGGGSGIGPVATVPEPGTLALVALGLGGLASARRRDH